MAGAKPSDAKSKEKPGKDGSSESKPSKGDKNSEPAKATVSEEKKEDDKRSALPKTTATTPPKKASSPVDSVLPVNMPNSMLTPNNNRPPSRSSLSVQSAGSAGGRTTTSRRGGRTRSRSPTAGHTVHYGSRPPSATPSVPPEAGHQGTTNSSVPPSPRNPSAAAAAAAAAAKSFRNPNVGSRGSGSSGNPSMHPSAMHYPHQQQPPHYGSPRDPYGRHPPQGRPDPYSSRYPGAPPAGQRQPQRPPSSASTSYPGGQPQQQPQRPHSRSSASYPGGPPPPGYYDPHNGSRNPSSSSHHHYHQQHPRSSSRAGPPPGSRYDSQPPPHGVGPDGRPLSRNGPADPQNPYGYNPYHRSSGAPPPSSRGGIPPGGGREYGSQYAGGTGNSSSSGGRYGGPPGGGPGAVDGGEYGRQHHSSSNASSSGRHGHTPPPHHHHQYQGGGPPPSSSRAGRQPYSGGGGHHHPSYRHGDPNSRGPPPPHYRGGPPQAHPPPHSSRGPPPGHPDYHRYHSQQQQLKQQKGGGGEGMSKSTRTVIGTATPLHLNKGGPHAPTQAPPPESQQPKSAQQSNKRNSGNTSSSSNSASKGRESASARRGSAASVFRPGPSGGPVAGNNNHHPDSNNPKSILDSLDTPSNSFEEKKSSRGEGSSQQAKDSELSPEDPPKLRSSGNNAGSNTADLTFDPQRSPKSQATGVAGALTMSPPQLTNSLDMAPSFSLFNQSFDSLGDTAQFFNVSGALDSAMLNSSTSFELKTSGSRSPSSSADHGLQLSASNGTFKLNASMSGGAIFGMSPTNSFGNGPTASFSTNGPGGSVTVLGDGRSASPSHVLDMYKTGAGGSLEEVDLRLSASLGSPMIGTVGSYSSSRPFATGVEGGPPQPSLSSGDYKSSGHQPPHQPSHQPSHQPPHQPSHQPPSRRSHLSPRPQRRYSASSHYQYRPQRHLSFGPPNKDGSPRFYNFLRTNKDAFLDVTFLLPELKIAVMESKAALAQKSKKGAKIKNEDGLISNENTPKRGQVSRNRGSRYDRTPTEAESAIARRRIVSAVCAFGGTFTGNRINNPSAGIEGSPDTMTSGSKISSSKSNSQSIFREKSSEPATVTPNSSGSSSTTPATGAGQNGRSKISPEQAKYDGALPTRYYESDNRLSWEFEENPPIGSSRVNIGSSIVVDPTSFNWCQEIGNEDDNDGDGKARKKRKTRTEGQEGVTDDSDDEEKGEDGDGSKKSKGGKRESSKMRYRCKLCGQPKTNHVCPYQQSLVRNIGVMVQPAVNAFTAAEPGQLAPALTEMNNLAISAAAVAAENNRSNSSSLVHESSSPTRPTPDRSSVRGSSKKAADGEATPSAAQVTPESLRSGSRSDNPVTPNRRTRNNPSSAPGSSGRRGTRSSASTPSTVPSSTPRTKKRSHARMSGNAGDQTDLLFVEEMDLKPEQFRMVTPSKVVSENPDAFTYPALPLPYAQRKRLSDNLFSLSKEIPQLTDECAAVLREARERDLWDLAVAELMTQVVVVVHCHDGDTCFEGLRRYLLTLGFTC